MKNNLSWKRRTFSTTYQIFSDEQVIGELQNSAFKQTSEGILRQKKYQFKTKGLFKQDTSIIDVNRGMEIGKITYNSWKSKASIQFSDRTIGWKYDNRWHTKWSLYNEQGSIMKFAGGSSKGTIEFDNSDDLLVLTGLFVTNYYQQAMIAVIVAIFIPLWVTLFT